MLNGIFKERASEIWQLLKMGWAQIGAKVLNMGMIASSAMLTLLYYVHEGSDLTLEVPFLCVSILSAMNTLLNYFGLLGLHTLFLVLATFRRVTEVLLLGDARLLPKLLVDSRG